MRFIDGGTLATAIEDGRSKVGDGNGPFRQSSFLHSRSSVAALLVTVSRAVHYAHQRGILHRDLKPGNILLDANGEPHVTDFGLAKALESESDLTGTAAVMGTPSYMSPEQASGRTKQLTTSSDVFSLGAILYELLVGHPPFQGATPVETLRRVMEEEPKTPRSINPAIDADLETICLKCLQKDPAQRYASADAFADDLERWRTGEPIQARPSNAWERTIKWARRKPAMAALAGVSCLAAVSLVVAGWIQLQCPAETGLRASRRGQSGGRSQRKEVAQRKRAEDAQGCGESQRWRTNSAATGREVPHRIAKGPLHQEHHLG